MCESLSQLCCARVCINTFAYLAAAPSAQQESQRRNIRFSSRRAPTASGQN